jgi:quercetin dioxygenase-like cupin family protein
MSRSRIVVSLLLMIGLTTSGVIVATADTATPSSAPKAQRVDLAAGSPSFARGYRLSLTRAVIPPGAAFPPHRHPGMQVSYVESGVLQFKVFRGSVPVYSGTPDGSQKLVRVIRAGHTGSIETGQWIVENQHLWHQGVNAGHATVVILLATLLRSNEPPAIPVKP